VRCLRDLNTEIRNRKFNDVIKNCDVAHTTAIFVQLLVAMATVRTGTSTERRYAFLFSVRSALRNKTGLLFVSHHDNREQAKVPQRTLSNRDLIQLV
jgi:hypothetical protein